MMGKKLGIVLSGGGARGAYQIGAFKALKEAGLVDNVYAYSGASVGSLNAVMLAAGDLDKAASVWRALDRDSLFTVDKGFFQRLWEARGNLIHEGYYKTDALEKLIESTIDYEVIRQNRIHVATTRVAEEDASIFELLSTNIRNWFDKEDHIIYQRLDLLDRATIKQSLLASCAIPIVFKPIVIDQQTYYDGGVLDRTPVQPLIDDGCDEIIMIDLFRFRRRNRVKDDNIAFHVIKPSKALGGILDFSNALIERRLTTGYNDGKAFVEKYKSGQ